MRISRLLFFCFLMVAVYIGSIFWRVSVAELRLFGRSDLIPLSSNPPRGKEPPVPRSFGSKTYRFDREGTRVIVWKQEINGFQHVFGSALMAFEVGDRVADLTFCGNEYLEAYFDPNGISDRDFKDRRKDLYHNRLGREIGMQARQLGLSGSKGEQYLIQKILEEMKTGERFIHHYKDPRVQTIGTEEQLGCSGLPAKNLVDTLLNRTQKDKPSDE